MRRLTILLIALLCLACDEPDSGLRMPAGMMPAAAELAQGVDEETLERQLERLEAELAAAREGELGRLLTAEAITDGLVHADRDVDWLAPGYDVEARLRQLQSMADRLVARLQRGATAAGVEAEVAELQTAVRDLRQRMAASSAGAPPPTLDSLLAQDPLENVQAGVLDRVGGGDPVAESVDPRLQPEEPTPPRTGGPIGTPIPPDSTLLR